ncbi:EamA family transporter [Nocardia otitidiscaviarum]|uniref:EamA family transporter n=1 Tax=Nocardia otitidiscaviarum TaxID=1823 RepID=UPI00189625D7|nr:EamA family transporter [Nocardia otitidiscaviarum]MBF6179745.1 EamA family transporter [Nocardia otitidiscaviarum]
MSTGSGISRPTRVFPSLPAPVLVLGAMLSIQLGSVVAKQLLESAGATTTAATRLLFAGIIALLLWRPSLRIERRALPAIMGFGAAIAGMNLCFYAAIERIPLGMAVTIEFLGPLTVALATSRRRLDALWVALAAGGVLLLMKGDGPVSWSGIGFAMLAGVGWGSYIACSSVLGNRTSGGDGLALAMGFGALLAVPVVISDAATVFTDPLFLAAALGVALLASLIPHLAELEALRRMPTATFGVLMSVEPAIAAAAGLLFLGEELAVPQWAGIALVVLATAGSTRTAAPETPTAAPERTPATAPPTRSDTDHTPVLAG